MKKLLAIICALFLITATAHAQEGVKAIGGQLSYGSEIESLGIGLKYQYNITDNIRLEPSFDYFFKKNDVSMFDINLNAHYLLPLDGNVRIYPLAGLTYTNWHWDLGEAGGYNINGSKAKIGVNLGGGIECDLSSDWKMNLDVKYQLISDWDQCVVSLGVAYMF